MKTMTCKQLGGACDMEFHAATFDEMAALSQAHGQEMFEKEDLPHMKAMDRMGRLMEDPKAMQTWMDEKRAEFNALPESN